MSAVRLQQLPVGFGVTRDALHRIAAEVVAPARKPHNEIALRQTPGGFGTPVFDHGGACQVRVEGVELVVRRGESEAREEIRSVRAAAAFCGEDLLRDGIPTDDSPLGLDAEAAWALATWFAFGRDVLAALAGEWWGTGAADPSLIQLWPEHFDIALEAGSEPDGRRANYGASPGDDDHPEPYLYVGPWSAEVEGVAWNAQGFRGAELGYAELADAAEPREAALAFMRERARLLENRELR